MGYGTAAAPRRKSPRRRKFSAHKHSRPAQAEISVCGVGRNKNKKKAVTNNLVRDGMAERMRLERTTPCGAPHFQCGSLPLEYLSMCTLNSAFLLYPIQNEKSRSFLQFFEKKIRVSFLGML